ncbi:S8 family serine peptidase [Streptomyces sp. NBC_00019]|uniref:S8 family serine peptidase n=1 Tax=Streptomyces sp. NBC_00019 TaxID=2975623 RepID=UPI00386475C3
MEGTGAVVLRHGLEAVKILDGASQDAASPRTYAEVTANAVATAEIEGVNAGPLRARVFSMAVTRQSGDRENGVDGTATLWSAALDALAAGTDVVAHDDRIELLGAPEPDAARLIVVSAGNVRGLTPEQIRTPDGKLDHLTMCDLSRIEEPAQAHNILAVGAFTELTAVPDDPSYAGFRPLAAHGQLSPFSRTSVALTGAPVVKPDIVLEGGNLLVDPGETMLDRHDVVSVTTTSKDAFRLITSANATSAATAQAARLATLAQAAYPGLSPEGASGFGKDAGHKAPISLSSSRRPRMVQGLALIAAPGPALDHGPFSEQEPVVPARDTHGRSQECEEGWRHRQGHRQVEVLADGHANVPGGCLYVLRQG